MVPRASLRAFEPLDAFPPLERERWGASVASVSGLTRSEARDTEERASVRLLTGRRIDALTGRSVDQTRGLAPDAALVRRMGGRLLLCPLQLELRAAWALNELRQVVPSEVADSFVPETVRGRLDGVSFAGRVPHILDAAWAIPLTWFLAFVPAERHLTDPPEGAGPRLTYLTRRSQADERLTRVIDVVEDTLDDGDTVLAALAEVAAWLDAFHADTVIELDYGTIAGLFSSDELAADRTCEDLWQSVDNLAAGDFLGAAAYYGVARSRWSAATALSSAS